jgi:hypothetical protein
VTYWLDKEQVVNTDDVKIEMQIEDTGADPVMPAPDEAASDAAPASAASVASTPSDPALIDPNDLRP